MTARLNAHSSPAIPEVELVHSKQKGTSAGLIWGFVLFENADLMRLTKFLQVDVWITRVLLSAVDVPSTRKDPTFISLYDHNSIRTYPKYERPSSLRVYN